MATKREVDIAKKLWDCLNHNQREVILTCMPNLGGYGQTEIRHMSRKKMKDIEFIFIPEIALRIVRYMILNPEEVQEIIKNYK